MSWLLQSLIDVSNPTIHQPYQFNTILNHLPRFCTGLERPRSGTATCPLGSTLDELVIPHEQNDIQTQHTELQILSRQMVHYEAKLDCEPISPEKNRATPEGIIAFDSKLSQLTSSTSIHQNDNCTLSYPQTVDTDSLYPRQRQFIYLTCS